jgi:hypothetical protein
MHATGFATIPVEDLPIDLRKTGKFLSGPDLTAYRQALAEREKLAPKQTAIIEQAQAEQARTKHTEETEEERKRTELKQYEQQVKSEQSDHEPSTTPKTESPRIITVEQLKQIWINSLSSPRTLDQNYHQVQRSNREFKNQVVSGTLDSVAWLYVAYLNMNEYNRVGQHEMALLLANRIKEYEQRQEATDRSRAAIGSSMEKDSKIRELEQKVDSLKRDSFFLKH